MKVVQVWEYRERGVETLLDVISIGPLLIKTTTIIYILAGVLGYGAILYRLRREPSLRKHIAEIISSAAILALFTWKFSYALFNPLKVWENPASLLYFSGGDAGVWLGGLAAAVYMAVQIRKRQLPARDVLEAVFLSVVAAQSPQMKKWVAVFGIVGLIAWGFLDNGVTSLLPAQESAQGERKVGLNQGELAPDFELRTLDNTPIRLSELRGQKVIVNLWATWCPPCRAEMPDMQEFYEQEKENGVTILGVNLIETEQGPESVDAFLKEYGITFPVVLDQGKHISQQYQAISIPTSYVIDTEGVVQYKMIGPLTKEMMEKMIAAID
ncbi:TlpA disulfide reductase family protein [Brevibacillus invocatus]|uniref:TlpA disulfide reductase family protein n=1 Tax=Brevibacillus invocatus TaxID=173959 RepID=UPI00203EB6DE|nr:TlpA disulfide reductase family protein [Brevibacillus invocatus]MCM3081865.1 TlpA family protein disulfide reductase [Brevibacillus invocatus]MCM3432285.1 TlpA family protein disulfide reductase [Brevibacillus invocatus]